MNFSEITKITIPEGNVSKITDSHGTILWSFSPVTFLDYIIMPAKSYTRIPFTGDLNHVRFDFSHIINYSVSNTSLLGLTYNSYDYLQFNVFSTTFYTKFIDVKENIYSNQALSEQWISYLCDTDSTNYNMNIKKLDDSSIIKSASAAKSQSNNIPELVYINIGSSSSSKPLNVKLFEVNNIVYKPAKDKDGVIGLFDTKNKILYSSATTTSFIEPN